MNDHDDLTDERIAHIPTHPVDALCLEASQRSGGMWGRYVVLWDPQLNRFDIVSEVRLRKVKP